MNELDSAMIAKLAIGQWGREFTAELGAGYYLVLQEFDYDQAYAALTTLLRQPGRKWPPNAGEIVGQILGAGGDDRRAQYLDCLKECASWPMPGAEDYSDYYERPVWNEEKQKWLKKRYVRAGRDHRADWKAEQMKLRGGQVECVYPRRNGKWIRHLQPIDRCFFDGFRWWPKIEYCCWHIEAETGQATYEFGGAPPGMVLTNRDKQYFYDKAKARAWSKDGSVAWFATIDALLDRAIDAATAKLRENRAKRTPQNERAPFVFLTDAELADLHNRHGRDLVTLTIESYSNWLLKDKSQQRIKEHEAKSAVTAIEMRLLGVWKNIIVPHAVRKQTQHQERF